MGFEVARALECPLDVLVVRKIGVPFHPELAMGAIAEGGVVVRNTDLMAEVSVGEAEFAATVENEVREVAHRVETYRAGAPPVPVDGHTAIIVDDGIATGSTALAAIGVMAETGAASIWLAVPVAPRGPLGDVETRADRFVALHRPRNFVSVGTWFRDFTQVGDREVRALLAESPLA